MFCGYLLVIDNKNAQILRTDTIGSGVLVFTVVQRDDDVELRAYALLGFYGDRAVHELDYVLSNRQTQTRAAVFVVAAGILLGKGIEDVRKEILLHTYTGILYGQLDRRMVFE